MVAEFKTNGYVKGVQNKLPPEDIEQAAASDALNWVSVDGKLELARGRRVVGTAGAQGGIYGDIWAPRVDGTRIHFVKRDTDIGYYDDDETFVPVITGLTADSPYTFSAYSSLAGNYLFATGPDGLYKIALANPGSFKNMYVLDEEGVESENSDNYLGYSIINDRRMILWNRFDDVENKTALFLSRIDPQDGTNYQFIGRETLATGNGVQTAFAGTLGAPGNAAARNFAFGVKIYGDTQDITEAITGVVPDATNTGFNVADTTGFAVADWVLVTGIDGTGTMEADLNDQVFQITTVGVGIIGIRGASSGAWTSGGTLRRYRQDPIEDDNNGGFQNGITGTINYATGAVTVTLPYVQANTVPITVSYQYEDSNVGGITDFGTSDSTDYTQGTAILQEYLGEAIQNVLVFEGGYYSFKKTCVYELLPSNDWSTYTNQVYRQDIGIPSLRAATSTGLGMVYMDTANPSKPILSILQRSTVGGNLSPVNLTPLFAWENYEFDQCLVDTWGQNIIVSARSPGSDTNDRLFLVNVAQGYSVDITYYGANTASKNNGLLYLGSPTQNTVFETFSGFDDLGMELENYWEGKAENYGDDSLHKFRYQQFKGLIDPNQAYQVCNIYDNGDAELVGTIRGDQSYVDYGNPQVIGSNMIGESTLGGDAVTTVYPYLTQLKIKTPKFRTRKLRFVALGVGYVNIEWQKDFDILTFEQRLPSRYRTQVYQSLDGTESDLANMP